MAIGIGIELDPAAVRAVALDSSRGRLALLAAAEHPCDTADPDALSRALLKVRRQLPAAAPIVLGIPSTWAIFTTIHPLIATPSRAALAIQFELQQQLPFALSEAVWHYQWLPSGDGAPQGRSGLWAVGWGPRLRRNRPEPRAPSPERLSRAVVVCAMRRSLLDERLAACRRAGLAVRVVAISPVAVLNACAPPLPEDRGGGGATATLLHLLTPQQGEWIVATPSSLHVVPIASASPELLGQTITTSWEALRAQGIEASAAIGVVDRSGLWSQLQGALLAPLEPRAQPIELPGGAGSASGRLERPERFIVAYGLALQGLGLARVPLNLLAGVRRERQAQQIRRASLMASVVCAALAVVFGLRGMLGIRAQRLEILRTLERREQLYQTLRPEVRAMLQQQQDLEDRNHRLGQLAGEAQALTRLLHEVAAALPDHVWLTRAECLKRDGVLIGRLEGRAASFQEVTQLFERLKSVAKMTMVKPLSTTVTTDAASGKELISFAVQVQRSLQPP